MCLCCPLIQSCRSGFFSDPGKNYSDPDNKIRILILIFNSFFKLVKQTEAIVEPIIIFYRFFLHVVKEKEFKKESETCKGIRLGSASKPWSMEPYNTSLRTMIWIRIHLLRRVGSGSATLLLSVQPYHTSFRTWIWIRILLLRRVGSSCFEGSDPDLQACLYRWNHICHPSHHSSAWRGRFRAKARVGVPNIIYCVSKK